MTRVDSGFTLVEMLVSLLVLSAAAAGLFMTFGSALDGYGRLQDKSLAAEDLTRLQRVMTIVSEHYFTSEDVSENVLNLEGVNIQKLVVDNSGDQWVLSYENTEGELVKVYVSEAPIRFSYQPYPEEREGQPRTPITVSLDSLSDEDEWISLVAVTPKVTAPSICRYDLVSRQCR